MYCNLIIMVATQIYTVLKWHKSIYTHKNLWELTNKNCSGLFIRWSFELNSCFWTANQILDNHAILHIFFIVSWEACSDNRWRQRWPWWIDGRTVSQLRDFVCRIKKKIEHFNQEALKIWVYICSNCIIQI